MTGLDSILSNVHKAIGEKNTADYEYYHRTFVGRWNEGNTPKITTAPVNSESEDVVNIGGLWFKKARGE